MIRVLRPGGLFLCLTPDWETQYRNFYNDCTHVKPFTKMSLEDQLTIVGLNNIDVEQFHQLPFVWKNNAFKIIPSIIASITPYSIYRKSKLTRFSRELMLLATARKP